MKKAILVLILMAVAGHAQMVSMPVISPMSQVSIGNDGNVYFLTVDYSATAGSTTVSAILPFSSATTPAWKQSLSGVATQVVTGAGTVIVPVMPVMRMGMGSVAVASGTLYFLKSTDGSKIATVTLPGTASNYTVRTVNGVDYLYVVTYTYPTPTAGTLVPFQARLQLTIYKMDGSVYKSITANKDNVTEDQ